MRYYTISPCFRRNSQGELERQGYDIICNFDKWRASHGTVELCETAILRREQLLNTARKKPQIYGKDYKIAYYQCKSEVGITDSRLELYQ